MSVFANTMLLRRPHRHEGIAVYMSLAGMILFIASYPHPVMWLGFALTASGNAYAWGFTSGSIYRRREQERHALGVLEPSLIRLIEEAEAAGDVPEFLLTEMRADLVRMRVRRKELGDK